MRWQLAMAFALVSAVSCNSEKKAERSAVTEHGSSATAPKRPRAPLADITAATKLDAVRAAFNAHKGEARFLTLLSPT